MVRHNGISAFTEHVVAAIRVIAVQLQCAWGFHRPNVHPFSILAFFVNSTLQANRSFWGTHSQVAALSAKGVEWRRL